jgi:hypothetical protein
MTHLVSSSCKRKFEHVLMCLGTWGCLTWHTVAKLNCHTMYTFISGKPG